MVRKARPASRIETAASRTSAKVLNTLNNAVRNIERDPSQVIFGGKPTLPEYNGR
jgi:phospholipid/cholesterol/gamma-HCH transport system substrate-binding protein